MDEIVVGSKTYVSLEKASQATRYDREYLRKLAKSGTIDGVQIGDIWMVEVRSIESYRAAKPQRKPREVKQRAG